MWANEQQDRESYVQKCLLPTVQPQHCVPTPIHRAVLVPARVTHVRFSVYQFPRRTKQEVTLTPWHILTYYFYKVIRGTNENSVLNSCSDFQ
jgi:hypothetical protein